MNGQAIYDRLHKRTYRLSVRDDELSAVVFVPISEESIMALQIFGSNSIGPGVRADLGGEATSFLQSPLFSGDPKLVAAATSDPAHVLLGAKGAHVGKLQFALLKLDGSVITQSELRQQLYGQSTADAVLAYKRKRNIINKAYQTQADKIVGKMTMASLDAELLRCAPAVNPRIRLLLGLPYPRPLLVTQPRFRRVSKQLVGADPGSARSPVVIGPVGQTSRIQVTVGAIATFRIEGGAGDSIMCLNDKIAKLEDPNDPSFDGSFGGLSPRTRTSFASAASTPARRPSTWSS